MLSIGFTQKFCVMDMGQKFIKNIRAAGYTQFSSQWRPFDTERAKQPRMFVNYLLFPLVIRPRFDDI